jgi:hypothetical protein
VETPDIETIAALFKALADPTRLRILGALADQPRTGKDLVDQLGLGAPTISHHMAKLASVRLVTVTRDGQSHVYRLNDQTLRNLALTPGTSNRSAEPSPESEDPESGQRAKVLRDFFDGQRLRQIPAQRKKRVIVLQHLVTWFDPAQDYPEREVNDLLREAHPDVATLRRELVDYGFMTRAGGVYRVARELPARSTQVDQEIAGDEHAWLRRLLSSPKDQSLQDSSGR